MKYSDEALLAKLRATDFSCESANYDKNLEVLQDKLSQMNKERYEMSGFKRIRRPMAIMVAVIALMVVSAATLVASYTVRNRSMRAVRIQHDDGSMTIRGIAIEGEDASTVRLSEDGTLEVIHADGTTEQIHVYDAADLCPTDELLAPFDGESEYRVYTAYRMVDAPGLRGMRSLTAETCPIITAHHVSEGYSVVQAGEYTIFYQMTNDYGLVPGAAVVKDCGAVYFVSDCGEYRQVLFQP